MASRIQQDSFIDDSDETWYVLYCYWLNGRLVNVLHIAHYVWRSSIFQTATSNLALAVTKSVYPLLTLHR